MKNSNFVFSRSENSMSAEGGVFMDCISNLKGKFLIACAGVALLACAFVPAMAFAVDYPGVEDGIAVTGNEATTAVGLKADDSQLSFSAPAGVNFALISSGTDAGNFEYPTAGLAKFTNNSIIDIRVKSFTVTSDAAAKGFEDVSTAGSQKNAYQVSVTPGSGSPVSFAVSQVSLSTTDWKVGHTSGANTLGLTFSNGKMVNVESGTWADGHNLQTVVWTVTAA